MATIKQLDKRSGITYIYEMDAITALQLYRNKDVVEKAFSNIKDRLNMRRLLVSSEKSLDEKLFVGFIALIYLSHIKKKWKQPAY